ncbi:MobF family relaxase [Amycolatopsis sp. GM8]|uniref:MobF family relaxase n=1 Tax=Amycolatopsis sp. GM8 TaxID=2896530 RepID=UPI001F1A0FD2|nr:MobF family relaxase [Amycolatopsis sp. GM8]
MTPRVLHAGDGYTYLTRNVASGDNDRGRGDPLVDYYTTSGDPPGYWVGAGCADLGVSGEVTEEHMLALFGEGLRPDANEFIAEQITGGSSIDGAIKAARLGRRMPQFDSHVPLSVGLRDEYAAFARRHHRRPTVAERHDLKTEVGRRLLQERHPHRPITSEREIRKFLQDELGKARQPVSGFDLVFAPAKSVSLLWALGDRWLREQVERAHHDAWRAALAYGEREAAFTRVGAGGVAQVDTSGFVATAFDHRDSRAGDPHLHTHVAVANRVLAGDGKWRTVDGQQLFKAAVSISETYNAMLEQLMTERLGVAWAKRSVGPGKQAVHEIAGMPPEWITAFSKRRAQVEAGYDALVAEYVARYGHTPPRSVQIQLAQQAQLGRDRPDKPDPVPLAQMLQRWRAEAQQITPHLDLETVIGGCTPGGGRGAAAGIPDLGVLAEIVIDKVSRARSTWTIYHVRAEALRQLWDIPFASMAERSTAVENIVGLALERSSIQLDVAVDTTPVLLQRRDGFSIFHRHASIRYTSSEILAAEARLLTDSRTRGGPVVPAAARDRAVAAFERGRGLVLNPGQRTLVEHFVSSGAALAVAIGPPGSGKSTAMRAVRTAWETTGGRVIGLAPSAAAASVLTDELNAGDQLAPRQTPSARADTLHSLTAGWENGQDVDVRAGDMLLVDEAGMADTRTLDTVREIAEHAGAVVRLVGDHRQLGAVEAGGALRLLYHDTGGVELTDVRRFARPDEAEAVLQFRVGDPRAIGFYEDNDRLVGGARAAVLDQLYHDWQADLAGSATSIMISDSRDIARELSARAQTDLRARGLVATTGFALRDGTVAGVGDRIVTRLNRRRLIVNNGRDMVKNGDLWTVQQAHTDGRLTVRHIRHRGHVTLPAWYVDEHVELGYASTIHRAQGLTVDIARSYLTGSTVREAALVALSRGIHGNYAYLDVEDIQQVTEPTVLPGELFYRHRNTSGAARALAQILDREGAERSATEELRSALDEPFRLDLAVPRYAHAMLVWRGPDAARKAEAWVWAAMPDQADGILADPAWPALQTVLHEARDAGANPMRLLQACAQARELDTAESVAQVMHYRVSAAMPTPRPGVDRPPLLPGWVATPPRADDPDAPRGPDSLELAAWLRRRAGAIADRVGALGDSVATNPPAWAELLGEVPANPISRAAWIGRAGQVAAYREAFGVSPGVPELLPEHHGGAQGRARSWVERYLSTTAKPQWRAISRIATSSSSRAARLRGALDGLTGRLQRPRHSSPESVPRDTERDVGPEP